MKSCLYTTQWLTKDISHESWICEIGKKKVLWLKEGREFCELPYCSAAASKCGSLLWSPTGPLSETLTFSVLFLLLKQCSIYAGKSFKISLSTCTKPSQIVMRGQYMHPKPLSPKPHFILLLLVSGLSLK